MNKKRCITAFVLLGAALILLLVVNLMTGSTGISFSDIISMISDKEKTMEYNIIFAIRLPRMGAAVLLGGALALSGYLLQTFFGNPIAGPFVLGISSGAKLTVSLAMVFFISRGKNIGSAGLVTAAFLGAMLAMAFVLLVSIRVKNMSILIVCGIMTGYICSAVTDLIITFAEDSNIVNLHSWSLGSLSGIKGRDIIIMAVIILTCFIFTLFLSKPIGAYRLGEGYARSMGVNIIGLRVLLILISSLLAATVTAFAGPISFVGIAVPHLVRYLAKTSSPYVMIPGSFLCGAVVTLLCDGLARTVFAPTEVSISSVTAVLLVPVVIGVMMSRKIKD